MMTQEERIDILNILKRLANESYCGDCMFFDECIPKEKCIYDTAHDLIANDDSMPVVHGHWVGIDEDGGYAEKYECSVCRCIIDLRDYNIGCGYAYCPYCGAKMDENDGENDATN